MSIRENKRYEWYPISVYLQPNRQNNYKKKDQKLKQMVASLIILSVLSPQLLIKSGHYATKL